MLNYFAFNKDVFENIPESSNTILDVGCGVGALGQELKKRNLNCNVLGLTYSREEELIANKVLDQVIVCDINLNLPSISQKFDCIIFSHVLEHTMNPDKVLIHFKEFLNPEGIVIIALPNVMYYKQRWQFVRGNFTYSLEGGLMDKTHYTFFDFHSATNLLINSGLEVVKIYATGNIPLGPIRKVFPSISKKCDSIFLNKLPGLFGLQFILIGRR